MRNGRRPATVVDPQSGNGLPRVKGLEPRLLPVHDRPVGLGGIRAGLPAVLNCCVSRPPPIGSPCASVISSPSMFSV